MFNSPVSDPSTRASNNSNNPFDKLIHSFLSHDSNIMLAAIISLLVVILFVLLLHIYAKWFLFRARQRSRTRSVLVPQLVRASSRFHHFHSFAIDSTFSISPTKGLEPSAISSIPMFVYNSKSSTKDEVTDCAICLSVFEDEEIVRKLPNCSHAFHVECIDMWFDSHSTCPICRSCPVPPMGQDDGHKAVDQEITATTERDFNDGEALRMEIIIEVPNAENENGGATDDQTAPVSSSSSLSTVGESVKRMMSRNRSERKVHPSEGLAESHV